MKKVQPKPVKRISCPVCGELQVKVYPYSSYTLTGATNVPCTKCVAKSDKWVGIK